MIILIKSLKPIELFDQDLIDESEYEFIFIFKNCLQYIDLTFSNVETSIIQKYLLELDGKLIISTFRGIAPIENVPIFIIDIFENIRINKLKDLGL